MSGRFENMWVLVDPDHDIEARLIALRRWVVDTEKLIHDAPVELMSHPVVVQTVAQVKYARKEINKLEAKADASNPTRYSHIKHRGGKRAGFNEERYRLTADRTRRPW